MSEPYTLIAHKDGEWFAISSADREPREIGQFASKYAKRGCTITTTSSAQEHAAVLGALKPWSPKP